MNKKKLIITGTVLISLALTSCKEVAVTLETELRSRDTTYIAAVETADDKKILVEELGGVACVNCPAGIDQLNGYNSSGPYKDKLILVSIHTGSYTRPIVKEGYQSIQDFRTESGDRILSGIFGGESVGKPCAGFDRLPIGTGVAPANILDDKSKWSSMLAKAAMTTTTPVNISITSEYMAKDDAYDIGVKVAFTEAVSGELGLTVYLAENKIVDVQQFPSEYQKDYVFNHLFRGTLSSASGQNLLPQLTTKEAGRVFIQNYILKIDKSDTKQSFWKPENMDVVAFVSKTGDLFNQQVLQATVSPLR